MTKTAARRSPAGRLALPAALLAAMVLSHVPARAGEPISHLADLAIRNLVKSYAEAWRFDKRHGILGYLTDDAVLMPHHGHPPVEGRFAIDRFWWPDDAPRSGVSRFEITPDEIYGEGDLAFLRGRFHLDYWVGMDEERRTFSNEGNWLGIFVRNDQGRWLIHRAIWNDPEATETTEGMSTPAE